MESIFAPSGGDHYLVEQDLLEEKSVYIVDLAPIALDLSATRLRMSPKPLNNKAARSGKAEPENSAKGGHSAGKTNYSKVPSTPQARSHNGDTVSTTRSSQKRSAPPDDKDIVGKQKRSKKELSASGAPHLPPKIASANPTLRRPGSAPKGTSPQSSTNKLSSGTLKEQLQTLRNTHLPREKERVRKVKIECYLDDEQVTLAIAAVTEVVNSYYMPDMYLWSLLSTTTLAAAQQQPPWDRIQFPRLIRSKLVFPMFWGPKKLLSYPDAVADGIDNKYIQESAEAHIFLVKVLFNRSVLRLPQLIILDSCPHFLDRNSEEWQLAVSEMRRTVTNLGIWDPPTQDVTLLPSLESFQVAFEPEMELQVARQHNKWACGVHTIMNAWADALLFRIDTTCKMDPASYKLAVEVINLVLEGRATLRLVATLLVRTGFVLHGSRQQGQAMTELREGSKLFREYHRIHRTGELDYLIADQKEEAIQRLAILARENQLDSAMASSVARRTVLPRLRETALDEQAEAAKEAAETRLKEGKDEEEGQEEQQKSHLANATVLYFKDKVKRSHSATAHMNEFCEVLKRQGWILDADEGVILGNGHKASQEAKDEFIRLLGYYVEFEDRDRWWKRADSDFLQLYFEVWLDKRKAEDLSEPVPAIPSV